MSPMGSLQGRLIGIIIHICLGLELGSISEFLQGGKSKVSPKNIRYKIDSCAQIFFFF